jgi:two-component system, cell cycle sensor histidine kinase and response regulator CckA
MNTSYHSGFSLSQFITLSPIAIVRLNPQGTICEANAAFHRLTDHTMMQDSEASFYTFVKPEDHAVLSTLLIASEDTAADAPKAAITLGLQCGVNHSLTVLAYASHIPHNDQTDCLIYLVDQTEQKNLEMRFAHSQKMQAVGQLAGGVAHDFNNLLTAMIGFCDLLLMRHPAGDPSFADIMQVKQNANRAANLVRQLLAFSRRQTLQPKMLDVTDVIAELSNLIRRLIGEHITLNIQHGRDLGLLKADQGQLEQVIINLAVNARDAMPEGGSLRIESRRVQIGPEGLADKQMIAPSAEDVIAAGDYILLEIEDTGTGIPPEILSQIFEPFFSTKEIGSGTGLGLATVYGIVKQTGGSVYVKTALGKGTCFSLFFKRYADESSVSGEASVDATHADLTGGETILLVEDEAPVRMFAVRALRNKGYEVLESDCGEHALEVYAAHQGAIDLIVTDVMMPGINGPTMVETLRNDYADRMQHTEVIFISGYAEDAFTGTFGEGREFHFLAKPFTLKQLAAKVKDVLSSRALARSETH